ncbi:class I tRNA ligase family protein [Streptomyces sp. NBS 14/10]|uniref:class I tRNA ligase family protein n=1 Tax=Streptomyces sp. NBS 14/10 TaxID=1945643 RepID=UPI000B7D0409|nr:class I tRNA ligase family protein [Streptomyces sp. NBS 14/10]KAK1177363.1 class I tRNA ligase family protein [Streptomyces sp. NBS 14/10]
MSAPLWITATPPASHGELHIGHLAGPYVAADVLSRHLRADGQPVLFSTGMADHADSVRVRALRGGRKPEEVAEGYGAAIAADWLRAKVAFDQIVRPRQDRGYRRWLQNLFLELYGQGIIVARTRLQPYCPSCELWLTGAMVIGACPTCGARSEGSLCHECARPTDAELMDPVCALCGSPGRPRRCRRPYLPLEPLREPLAEYWASTVSSPRLAVLCEGLLEDGLPEVGVGHPGDWGVPVPVDDFRDQRIDACFEAAVMHLFGYGYVSGNEQRSLPERALHFCGFGHSFCHAVLLPAILIARGVKLPQEMHVNETYRIDTERAWDSGGGPGLWALDVLTEFGSDTVRRHVLEARPLGRRTDFRRDRLDRTRQVLEETWNSWLGRLFAAVREECAGLVPDTEPGGAGWEALRRRLLRAAEDLREAYGPEAFDPRRAVALLDEVVSCAADFGYVNVSERRRTRGEHLPPIVAQLSVAAALTSWAWPLMPEGAGRLAAALRMRAGGPVGPGALNPPCPGTRLDPPSGPVFGF